MRISSARNEDSGSYCCKGLMQSLNSCDKSATASIIVITLPKIIPKQNYTLNVGNNVTVECIIEHVGNPPFVLHRWQKSGHRLVMDRTKYISQQIENRVLLTILNSTAEDEGYYECVVETSTFEIEQASVYLSLNYTIRSHTGVSYVVITYVYIEIF